MRFFRGCLNARRRGCLLVAALLAASVTAAAEPAFGATTTVADWEMNEAAGATVMRDSSGSNLSGTIGSAVETGVVKAGAKGYRWSGRNKAGLHPERLVTVQSSLLNPGTAAFAVTVRLFTGAGDQNIIQKGQARTTGGMFKIDMVQGRAICTFKGSSGRAAIGSRQTVWDHVWHTVRCERRANSVSIIVDGGTPRTKFGETGNISNNKVLAIGGKAECNPPDVQCDYYVGLLDRAFVQRL